MTDKMKFNSKPENIIELAFLLLIPLKWFVWRQQNGMVLSRLTTAVFQEIITIAERYLIDISGNQPPFDFDPAAYDDEVKKWFNDGSVSEKAMGRGEFGQ
ncbi:hypothetical protein LCGC14_1038850 [marine sediment metagenome]|uniref:Uncharacterized protein n=1 Tax=marine sediment metagenome TaxID=412755 RepID=A0A0F9QYG8_9ZZZZ